MIALTILSVITTLVTLLLLIRTGRIIANQNDQIDAFVTAHNFQNRRLRDMEEMVENALDCLLTLDYRAASTSGENAD